MASTFEQLNFFLRTFVYLGVVVIVCFAGFEARRFLHADLALLEEKVQELDDIKKQHAREIGQKEQELKTQAAKVAELDREVQRTRTALRLLKLDHRLAKIEVLEQHPLAGEPAKIVTKVRFMEVDAQGRPAGRPIVSTLIGKTIYIDAQIVIFNDEFVELGDELKGRPLCRFRRMFGEDQAPSQGEPLDGIETSPGDLTPFEREIWKEFLTFANDPTKAQTQGIRAASGNAPSITPRPGMTYRVELRSSGALTIRPEETVQD